MKPGRRSRSPKSGDVTGITVGGLKVCVPTLGALGILGHHEGVTVVEQERRGVMADPAGHDTTEPIVRPAPHRWLWYALGGRLPARHRGWVLFDTTTGTWGLRHVA